MRPINQSEFLKRIKSQNQQESVSELIVNKIDMEIRNYNSELRERIAFLFSDLQLIPIDV